MRRNPLSIEFVESSLEPGSDSQPLPLEQIVALHENAFGGGDGIESVRELGGGTFNTTYLIARAVGPPVVLRVAPTVDSPRVSWEDAFLTDFTHRLIERDYMFQSFVAGERWDMAAEGTLSSKARTRLWTQFGDIVRRIHATEGEAFGTPYIGPMFPRWSDAVLHRFECIGRAAADNGMDNADLSAIIAIVRQRQPLLDEVSRPRLLHGDLWLFNLLIGRAEDGGATITGVLDADRAWWGDPNADWTMFVLAKSAGPEMHRGHVRFREAYGDGPERKGNAAFRARVYEAMNIASTLIWAARQGDEGMLARGTGELAEIARTL
jgi:aminoglycoside phosphotransferase (APT) family kinase protein